MEKRKESRIKKRCMLRFGESETNILGVSTDISNHGLRIASAKIVPTQKEIDIFIETDKEPIRFKGTVRWNFELSRMYSFRPKEMGIFITDPPRELVEYLKKLK